MLDRKADRVIHVFDAESGDLQHAFGRKGGGPSEFTGAWSLVTTDTAGVFWIYDTSLQRLTRVALRTDLQDGQFTSSRMVTLQTGSILNDPQWLFDGRLVSTGYFDRGLFGSFSANGEELAPIGTFPFGDPTAPATFRQASYRLTLAISPDRRRLVAGVRYADRLELFDATGRRLWSAKRPFNFDPAVRPGRTASSVAINDDVRYGYLSLHAGSQGVLALFSGRREGSFGRDAVFGRHVHDVSWDGTLRQVFELDDDVIAIARDPTGRWLYALRHDPEPALMLYPLPPPD